MCQPFGPALPASKRCGSDVWPADFVAAGAYLTRVLHSPGACPGVFRKSARVGICPAKRGIAQARWDERDDGAPRGPSQLALESDGGLHELRLALAQPDLRALQPGPHWADHRAPGAGPVDAAPRGSSGMGAEDQ